MSSPHISVATGQLQPPTYGSDDPSRLEQGDSHSDGHDRPPDGVSYRASKEVGKRATFTIKITLWRFTNTALLVGLGTAKAALAFGGNSIANSFDMALGLLWALM